MNRNYLIYNDKQFDVTQALMSIKVSKYFRLKYLTEDSEKCCNVYSWIFNFDPKADLNKTPASATWILDLL